MEVGASLVCSRSIGEKRLSSESAAVYSTVRPAFPLIFVTFKSHKRRTILCLIDMDY